MNLADLLETQRTHLVELLDLLRQEQDALVQGAPDGETLSQLAAAKQPLLQVLETLENRRLDAQDKLGYRRDLAGSSEAAREAGCLEQWQGIQDLSRRAAHLNQLNGSLIHQRLAHNQRVLADLRQLAGTPLYGANGQTHKSQGRIQSRA